MDSKKIVVTVYLIINGITLQAQQLNRSLMLQLDTIWKADQKYRSAEKQHNIKSAGEDEANMQQQRTLDLENLRKVENIIAGYGYPGKSLVGENYQSVVFMVIQHNDPEAREKYLPLIIAAAEKGELRNASLAIMIDRSKMDKGEKQVYGSQVRETPEGVKLYPIEDEPRVNIRRSKVGLPPLEEYLKHWNLIYRVPGTGFQNPASLYYSPPAATGPSSVVIGGNEVMYKKLSYPEKAREKGINGYVTVELTIDKEGRAKDITVARSLGYGCDEEAIRVIRETLFVNPGGKDYETRLRLPFPYVPK